MSGNNAIVQLRVIAITRRTASFFRKIAIACLLAVTMPLGATAVAATIDYELRHTGGNEYTISYAIAASGADLPIYEFSIFFNAQNYAGLRVIASPAGWDSLVIQPEPLLDSPGIFDSLVARPPLAAGALARGFVVAFEWNGAGQPGAQWFDIVDPNNLGIISSGYTSATAVPELGQLPLLIAGLALLGAYARCRNVPAGARPRARRFGGILLMAWVIPMAAQGQAAPGAANAGQLGVVDAAPPNVRITRMTKLAEERLGRTLFRYRYLVEVRNDGVPLTNVRVQLTSRGDNSVVLSGIVPVGDLGNGASASTQQDIVFTHDRVKPLLSTELRWRVIADPTGALARLDMGPALAGTDADANGIRDDVEAVIAELVPDQSIAVPALRIASALQQEILARSPDESLHAQIQFEKGLACLASRSKDYYRISQTVSVITFNTRERFEAYVRHKSSLPPNRDIDMSGTCQPEINDES